MSSENNNNFTQSVKHYVGKNLRWILGVLALVLGLVFMVIPFIPLGYILLFVALFFLSTFFPPLKRLMDYLKKKDDRDILKKYERKLDDAEERFTNDQEEDEEKPEQGESHSKQ